MDIKNDWFIDTSRSNPISQGSFKFVTLTVRSIILSIITYLMNVPCM